MSLMDGNEVSQGNGRIYRCRGLLLFSHRSQCIVGLGSKLCWAAKRLTGAGGFYFSRTGLNDPYGPRGGIRPRARHSQAGVSQLSNGTAPVLGGIRSHRQGGGGTEGAQGHPRAHLRQASREEGRSPEDMGRPPCRQGHHAPSRSNRDQREEAEDDARGGPPVHSRQNPRFSLL